MSTEQKPRQSATLYSWNTQADQIKVRITESGYLEVHIGDLSVIVSAVGGEKAIDLAEALAKVEVTETIKSTIRV
jgi:hypothetical protein